MKRRLMLAALLACSLSASPLIAADQALIVITTEPLRGNKPDVFVNGKRIAEVGVDNPYKGFHDPGKLLVTIRGDRLDLDAQANKEYMIEVDMKPSSAGMFFAFGLMGSSATQEYTLKLKGTRDQPAP